MVEKDIDEEEVFNDDYEVELCVHKAIQKAIDAFNKTVGEYDVALGLRVEVKWFYEGEAGVHKKYVVEENWDQEKTAFLHELLHRVTPRD